MIKLRTADGRQIKLTQGEANALCKHLTMNGTSRSRTQYDPGYVQMRTVWNLVKKGVFEEYQRCLYRVAAGVFEMGE